MKANRNFGCAFFFYFSPLILLCQILVLFEQFAHNLRFRHVLFEAVCRQHRLVVLAVGFAELQKSADFSDNINRRNQ